MSDNNKPVAGQVEANKTATKPTVVLSPSRYKKKSLIKGIVIALLVIILGVVLYRHYSHKQQVAAITPLAICNDRTYIGTLEQAAGALYTNNVTKQQSAITKLKEIPEYQRDPNCLYAIVSYYINISDPHNASLYLSSLEKVYNPKQGFSTVFVRPESIAELQSEITFLNNQAKAVENNGKVLSGR